MVFWPPARGRSRLDLVCVRVERRQASPYAVCCCVERLASYRRHSVWWFGFGAKGRAPLVYVLVCLVKSKLFIPLFSLKGGYLYKSRPDAYGSIQGGWSLLPYQSLLHSISVLC